MTDNSPKISTINKAAIQIFDEMLGIIDTLNGKVIESKMGPIIIDLGVDVHGGFLAGEYLSQICMGGLAEISIQTKDYDNLTLPTLTVTTDFPAEATLGSQFAGWAINKKGYQGMASGPARLLAKKPKTIYERIQLIEEVDETVVVLESENLPPDEILRYITDKCKITPDSLYVLVAPTTSIAGTTQIAARSVETALHKLFDLGFDVNTIVSAVGSSPIAPVNYRDKDLMMGRTNDMLIYGSEVYLQVDYENNKELESFLKKSTSKYSKEYGKLFYDIVNEVKGDFYKIDPSVFAPAKLLVNEVQSGLFFSYGELNNKLLLKSVNFIPK